MLLLNNNQKLKALTIISDQLVEWNTFRPADEVKTNFSQHDWYNIVDDIHSDREWELFLSSHSDFVLCYVLKRCDTKKAIAFIYLMFEYDDANVLSIHGGGWDEPVLYYRGYVLILKFLLEIGYKVRTYCSLANTSAIRFSRSVGFIPYRYTDSKVYMWISEKTLKRTMLYKRFYGSV